MSCIVNHQSSVVVLSCDDTTATLSTPSYDGAEPILLAALISNSLMSSYHLVMIRHPLYLHHLVMVQYQFCQLYLMMNRKNFCQLHIVMKSKLIESHEIYPNAENIFFVHLHFRSCEVDCHLQICCSTREFSSYFTGT